MDTFKLGIKTKLLSQFEMRREGWSVNGNKYFKHVRDKETGTVVAVLTASNYGDSKSYLSVTCSAPKLIYGTNVEMLIPDDLPCVFDTVNDIVAGNTRIEFDANTAKVMSIDFCHNWKLASEAEVSRYLTELQTRHVPYANYREVSSEEYGVPTVYWRNGSVVRLAYAKHIETLRLVKDGKLGTRYLSESYGMLRWEHRKKTAKKVKELADVFGCSQIADSFLGHVFEMNQQTLLDDMELLGLNKTIEITGKNERLKRLKEYCGDNEVKYMKLSGLLHNCDEKGGVKNVVSEGLMKDKTLRKWIDEIRAAGISLTEPTKGRTLPALKAPERERETDDFSFNKKELFSTGRILPIPSSELVTNIEGVF